MPLLPTQPPLNIPPPKVELSYVVMYVNGGPMGGNPPPPGAPMTFHGQVYFSIDIGNGNTSQIGISFDGAHGVDEAITQATMKLQQHNPPGSGHP